MELIMVKKNKKKIKIIAIVTSVVVLVLIVIISQLAYVISTSMTYRPSMRALAELTVPEYEWSGGEFAWGAFHFEGRDKYGRCMFTVCDISTKEIMAVIIVQINDEHYDYAYYYEGSSTLLIDDRIDDFSHIDDKLIEWLKKTNDWNEPLNYSKMASVST